MRPLTPLRVYVCVRTLHMYRTLYEKHMYARGLFLAPLSGQSQSC